MKKRFLSLKWKLLGVMTLLALLLTTTLTVLSLHQVEQQFEVQQKNKQLQLQQQFHQLNTLLSSQLLIWLESLAEINPTQSENRIDNYRHVLERHYEQMQFYMDIEGAWLYSSVQQQIFNSDVETPLAVKRGVAEVFDTQEASTFISCQRTCFQLSLVPLLGENNQVAVLAVASSLVDMLVHLKRALAADVGVMVPVDKSETSLLSHYRLLSVSNAQQNHALLERLNQQEQMTRLTHMGAELSWKQQDYQVSWLPLNVTGDDGAMLLLIEDVTEQAAARRDYQLQIILVAFGVVISVLLFIVFVLQRSSQRLLELAEKLPLLAKKQYVAVKRIAERKSVFSDELDVLTEASKELTQELEGLESEVAKHTQELERIAMYDLLSGLPNRNMLNFQLKQLLAGLDKRQGAAALLFLDLDDFKKVNDSYGHAEGDKLLKEVAKRLRHSLRETDMAFRFGGDEFIILIPSISHIDDARGMAESVLIAFKEAILVKRHRFYLTASVGISFAESARVSADELIKQADIAMYQAKEAGGSCYRIYDNDMYAKVAQQVELESEIREAIVLQQFALHLQPQVNLENGKLIGFEALIRWRHPKRGILAPYCFIPLLEQSEHIIELGYLVIRRTFEILKQLNAHGYSHLKVAVNLSSSQFSDPYLYDFLYTQLKQFNVGPEQIELELTEGTLVDDMEFTLEQMTKLKNLGFSLAIDDFGTGYSSLNYLKQMPVDIIKIDRCFVSGMLENQADLQIVCSTIAMVQRMGMNVVAEGVETMAQYKHLQRNQCNVAQGYLIAKPIDENILLQTLEENVSAGCWAGLPDSQGKISPHNKTA